MRIKSCPTLSLRFVLGFFLYGLFQRRPMDSSGSHSLKAAARSRAASGVFGLLVIGISSIRDGGFELRR